MRSKTINGEADRLNTKIKRKFIVHLSLAILLMGVGRQVMAAGSAKIAATYSEGNGLSVRVEANGNYSIEERKPRWTFSGSIGQPLKNVRTGRGQDANGLYRDISFVWKDGTLPMSSNIRLYRKSPVVVFSETCGAASEMPPAPFPSFTNLPASLHVFSYQEKNFAPPRFGTNDCSTPWLVFDDAANAMVISPASHFMVAAMSGDGKTQISSGLNDKLRNLPAGFSQQTILSFGHGINSTWDLWGKSLLALQNLQRPDNEADTVLKYFGYWTDNFAYYYYKYDLGKGYAGTLQALVDHYRQEQIPIRYMQLDSWWYYKTLTDADGKIGKPKSTNLPEGEWNRYGGLLQYKAHPALFPNGLAAFQQSIGLPLVTHNRWIDPASPYHQNYMISGVAAVDPKWWDDIAGYLKASGIVTYEQDWLDRIYKYSPEFSSTVDTADAFLDNMARACAAKDITLQYCMPYPCYFLQGSRYPNLTTIRTSDDGFCPARYDNFLYVSRLARSMGIWPWADVYRSTETNNVLLSALSAGPVGIGDEIGKENTDNIFKAVRADGLIVKPDVPALPLDECYIADANKKESPLLAATFTDHDGLKTEYFFAFNRSRSHSEEFHFTPAELGFVGPVAAYNYFSGTGRRIDFADTISGTLGTNGVAYYIVAPVGKSRIAFLGDKGKFVSNGRQRIASLKDEQHELTADVLFAPTESSVILHGYAPHALEVTAQSGQVKILNYAPETGYFKVEVNPDSAIAPENIDGDLVREVIVTLKEK